MPIMQGDKQVANVYNINNNSYAVPIGCIIPFSGSTIPVGFLLCDGSEVSKTDYAELYAVVSDLYGVATDTTKFKLPDLRNKFIQGANSNTGEIKEAGLPNITGTTGDSYIYINDTNATAVMGAFVCGAVATASIKGDIASKTISSLQFNASKSNSIYGNSDTVQPPSVCLSFIIKAEKISDQYATEVGALIDDTATTATNKVWSAKKVNDTFINTVKYSKCLNVNKSFTANIWNIIDEKTNWWAEKAIPIFKSAYESTSGTQVFGVIRVNATTGKLEFRPENDCDFVVLHMLVY